MRVQVWTPKEMSNDVRALFEQLKDVEGEPPAEDESFGRKLWERMKEVFGT